MSEYLTTRELAELLRIKERKVYDLAASGDVPCSKAMGKLLFPRAAVEAWLAASSTGFAAPTSAARPNVFLGSHDPLLEWALRESKCGLATFLDGSVDGLERFLGHEGVAAGMHLYDIEQDEWNRPLILQACAGQPVVLVQWALRSRGLIVGEARAGSVSSLPDLKGIKLAPRQAAAGAQKLLTDLLKRDGMDIETLEQGPPVRSETDAALAVLEGRADAAFGLQVIADQYRLPFVPIIEERFDLLIDRHAWFEPPLRQFIDFCQSAAFRDHAAALSGYDVSGFGAVRFNGP